MLAGQAVVANRLRRSGKQTGVVLSSDEEIDADAWNAIHKEMRSSAQCGMLWINAEASKVHGSATSTSALGHDGHRRGE